MILIMISIMIIIIIFIIKLKTAWEIVTFEKYYQINT